MLSNIAQPTLLLDEAKAKKNIKKLQEICRSKRIHLRPHFKTHQSHAIGRWFREAGVDRITVSSLKMAHYFAKDGWDNITYAFPFHARQLKDLNALAQRIELNVLLVNQEPLEDMFRLGWNTSMGVFIKIDTGSRRTGLRVDQQKEIRALIEKIHQVKGLQFKGLLSHAGHTYAARSVEEVNRIAEAEQQSLEGLYQEVCMDFPSVMISTGDTPGSSLGHAGPHVQELRPGNFIFYDTMMAQTGVCSLDEVAVAMACPVVAKHPDRNTLVLHGGAVHFSKDFLDKGDFKSYGQMVQLLEDENGKFSWRVLPKEFHIQRLSQEHGLLIINDQEYFESIGPGDLVGILPVHSCLTANLVGEFLCSNGDKMEQMH